VPDELDPKEVGDLLNEWSGDVLSRVALGDPSISEADIYEAVAVSWINSQDTLEGVLSPHNHRVVSLFIDP
jgi:hypothetical protein